MVRWTKKYYLESAVVLAPKLLGQYLVRKFPNGEIHKYKITETECYYGEEDTACHAHKGKTPRTKVLYEEGGLSYVYLCYGIHYLLNVVTGPKDHPEAVLIRGIEGFLGPGRLTKALGINKDLNEQDFTTSDELWIEEGLPDLPYQATKRIGIDYATEEYRNILWRFVIDEKKNR